MEDLSALAFMDAAAFAKPLAVKAAVSCKFLCHIHLYEASILGARQHQIFKQPWQVQDKSLALLF